MSLLRLVSASVRASVQAGHIIRHILQKGDLAVIDKGHNDPQTEADRSAQRCILSLLTSQFPRVTFIAEEDLTPSSSLYPSQEDLTTEPMFDQQNISIETFKSLYGEVRDEDLVVWVDPLDGTAEFTAGYIDHVTVLIGISHRGKAIAGVIHQPFFKNPSQNTLGRTIWGLVGLGIHGITPRQAPKDRKIVATTRTHASEIIEAAVESLTPDQVIRVGGAGYKVLMLLEGLAHWYVFPSTGCSKWDTCAPEALLTATGGKLTDIFGQEYEYSQNVARPNSRGVLAAYTAEAHAEAIAKMPPVVRNRFSAAL
eukprot:TRINITY_DN14752_c0_g1_i1.p1 TRINITY_DN14752_c0_g1~~TRINITY_DN14752_c0_g1_i1.p1  ORF type:complete len:311 (-),score=39.18 TRINITY_DN14752_c0_g1_i1:36-968(-)